VSIINARRRPEGLFHFPFSGFQKRSRIRRRVDDGTRTVRKSVVVFLSTVIPLFLRVS